MFQEILLAPFKQTNMLRSPDVARLPRVTGSTHAVMTPLWTPGLRALLSAEASDTTATDDTTTITATSQAPLGTFAILNSFRRLEQRTSAPQGHAPFDRKAQVGRTSTFVALHDVVRRATSQSARARAT
jgi:hypothetical protein